MLNIFSYFRRRTAPAHRKLVPDGEAIGLALDGWRHQWPPMSTLRACRRDRKRPQQTTRHGRRNKSVRSPGTATSVTTGRYRRRSNAAKHGRSLDRSGAAKAVARRPPPDKGVLSVHGVEKSFVGRKVVKTVSLYLRKGEAVGLLGPNGAGKTTCST